MAELSVRDKNKMVADIKVSYKRVRDIWKSAIEQSIEFGGELVYCKSQIEHGSWLRFLEVCDIPPRTATGAMRMHENRELLREKSAENWVDAVRIMQAETNPNRQRIADLTVSKPVETVAAKLETQIQELASVATSDPAVGTGEAKAFADSSIKPTDVMYYSEEQYDEKYTADLDLLREHFKAQYSLPNVSGSWTKWIPLDGTVAIMVEIIPVVERPGYFSVSIIRIEDDLLVRSYTTHAACLDRSIDDALMHLFETTDVVPQQDDIYSELATQSKTKATADHPFDSSELGSILTDAIKTYCESVICDAVDWFAIKETLTPVKWQLNSIAGVNEYEDDIEVSANVLQSLDASERQAFARKLLVMDTESAKHQALLQLSRIEKAVRELNPHRKDTLRSDEILEWFTPED